MRKNAIWRSSPSDVSCKTVFSTGMTLSAPGGTTAPVDIRITSPCLRALVTF